MKPWYRSKTIMLNLAVVTLAAAESSSGALRDVLPNFYAVIAFVLPVLNAALRLITNESIGGKND